MRRLYAMAMCGTLLAAMGAGGRCSHGQEPSEKQTVPAAQKQQEQVPAKTAQQAAGQANAAADTQKHDTAPPPQDTAVVLDSVVAIINGDVILQSDVEQERRFERLELLPEDQNTDAQAAEHLVTRTLVVQQMKEEAQVVNPVTDADVAKLLDELKKQLPGCLPHKCDTDQGWSDYLATLQLTPQEVSDRWRQRVTVLDYLNLRFKTGVRIPTKQAEDYYQQTLVPEFTAKHVKAPSFKTLAPRIKDILLQQQVSKQIDQWETLLRQEGSVQILVPAYGASSTNDEDDDAVGGGA